MVQDTTQFPTAAEKAADPKAPPVRRWIKDQRRAIAGANQREEIL
jgi:hypothetical protein